MLIKERKHPIVEGIGGGNGMLRLIELGKGNAAIGVDKGLLINPADAFDISDIVSVLRSQVSGMLGLDLSKGFPALFLAFHSDQLGFGKNEPFLGYTGF